MYDLLILGAGPAGLTAALYAARKKINLLILSKELGGQVMWTKDIENYMGYQFITGPELMQKFDEQIKEHLPPELIRYEAVETLRQNEEGYFAVETGKAEYLAKAVIAATGKRPRHLNVPGELALRGRGVSYCATCDGPLFRNKSVAVVGGGNSALQAALELSGVASKVYLIDRSGYRADAVVVDKVNQTDKIIKLHKYQTKEIVGEHLVKALVLTDEARNEKSLDVQGVFVEVGLVPNTAYLKGFIDLNERQEAIVDCRCRTNIPGVFAAGDVTNSVDKQIIIAAGDGAKAAMAAGEYLLRR